MERVGGVTAVRARVAQRADHLVHLEERARPPVGDHERERVRPDAARVDRVHLHPAAVDEHLRVARSTSPAGAPSCTRGASTRTARGASRCRCRSPSPRRAASAASASPRGGRRGRRSRRRRCRSGKVRSGHLGCLHFSIRWRTCGERLHRSPVASGRGDAQPLLEERVVELRVAVARRGSARRPRASAIANSSGAMIDVGECSRHGRGRSRRRGRSRAASSGPRPTRGTGSTSAPRRARPPCARARPRRARARA